MKFLLLVTILFALLAVTMAINKKAIPFTNAPIFTGGSGGEDHCSDVNDFCGMGQGSNANPHQSTTGGQSGEKGQW
ncbi:hypothetical protein CYY_005690 [Polysphondylium violaceum]|uniref:Uncharacterized protein n=1 Tax=Polysphondylium violaceum TaxID=133409 RepID=A0A8J4PT38_9MYCE|nr:hypothetical protein CYY_005690 [Polysphondylium violaceum]